MAHFSNALKSKPKWKFIFILLALNFHLTNKSLFSQDLLKYNTQTNTIEEAKKIPFDKSFTMQIYPINGRLVQSVYIHEAMISDGNRTLVYTNTTKSKNKLRCTRCPPNEISCDECQSIADKVLSFTPDSNSINISIDALKPNKYFDLQIYMRLSKQQKEMINKLNLLIINKNPDASKLFNQIEDQLTDKNETYSAFQFTDYDSYSDYFAKMFNSLYAEFANVTETVADSITSDEFNALTASLINQKLGFARLQTLNEIIAKKQCKDFSIGIAESGLDISISQTAELSNGNLRISILTNNLNTLDTLIAKSKELFYIANGYVSQNSKIYSISDLLTKMRHLRTLLNANYLKLQAISEKISNQIDNDPKFRSFYYASANTIASDLKTSGASIVFLDLGFSNLFVKDLSGKFVYIPRLYTGVSIYFRPIDKSTRRNTFPSKKKICRTCYCVDKVNNEPTDYQVIATKSIWQHLSLNIGITWGSIPNKEFENFYNNSSLLIGPAWRFKRAFKFSSGISLVKRTSLNPLKSDKIVVPGYYFSVSADVDFLQGIKDLTQKFF
ncbi:MAG: hypothetical protein WBP58_15185 [Chitinophagaceae bacterium]